MLYCIDPLAEEPIMLIDRHIGFDEEAGMGIDGSLFQRELMQLDGLGKKRIQVWINSPGGIVMDGYNIYNAILKSKTKVDTYCVGIAASIAAVIFQAGRTRYMADYAKLMYHNAHGGDNKQLGVLNDSIAVMVASRSNKPKEDVLKMMDRTTWIGAGEAFSSGFCDVIEASNEYNRKRVTATEPKMMWKQSAEVLNSILNTNNKTMLTKVTNKLGLVESANEDAILNAITAIENKAVKFESDLTEAKNKLAEKESELTTAKNELDTLKAEKEAAEKAQKEAEDKAVEVKATNMVKGYATQGKIKNDEATIAKWTNLAKADYEGTEQMLKELPTFKAANRIEVGQETNSEAALTSVVAMTMRDVRNKIESN